MRIGVIGGGWRSEFFLRIISALEEFEPAGVLRSTPEKAEETRRAFGVPAFTRLEELLAQGPDYVVLSVPRQAMLARLEELFRAGMPVLAETPPAATEEELIRLWAMLGEYKPAMMVAEQYFCQPYHAAGLRLAAEGRFGRVTSVTNSMMHGYHGINILRRYLGVGMAPCAISGRSFTFPITRTGGRQGPVTDGSLAEMQREWAVFEFEGGGTAFWDFSGEQYHSSIRDRHLLVQGTRGELCDTECHYLDAGNRPVRLQFQRLETGRYSNLEGFSLRGLMLGAEQVYANPFGSVRLNDDELAIATLMRNFAAHLQGGEPLLYPMADALQDSYLALCLEKALATGACQSWPMPWA